MENFLSTNHCVQVQWYNNIEENKKTIVSPLPLLLYVWEYFVFETSDVFKCFEILSQGLSEIFEVFRYFYVFLLVIVRQEILWAS